MPTTRSDFQPVTGEPVHDTHLDRPAVYMGQSSPFRWFLRPVGGGLEWDADPGDVRPALSDDSVWTR